MDDVDDLIVLWKRYLYSSDGGQQAHTTLLATFDIYYQALNLG